MHTNAKERAPAEVDRGAAPAVPATTPEVPGDVPAKVTEVERLRAELAAVRGQLAEALRATAGDRTQDELASRHAQRLESLGQLAAGVAHEINTPMQFISDNVHFLRDGFHGALVVLDRLRAVRDLARSGAVSEAVLAEADQAELDADLDYLTSRLDRAFTRTLEGIDRVSHIVAAMKVFAHPRDDLADVDLNQVLTTTLTVARNEYKYVADVVTELGNLPLVLGHAGDLNQLFLNLLINAAHAIVDAEAAGGAGGQGGRGKITVRTFTDAGQVVVEITDTGCGIAPADRPRVFDAYFTTKEPGRGTGQGLAIARSVVERHCGTIGFDSEVGVGTTFRVRLPVAGPETSKKLLRSELLP
ncbi:MAG TPA: ATP-binding protein [Kofleriaceae bacterium]|nr:ATP-binding protein [Kofleriaceae bacterium]